MDNTIDDAKFDEILKQNNVTPIAAGADPWADFGGPIVPKPSIIDTIKSRTNAVVENPGEAAKGFVKRAGRTAVDTAELMGKGFKAAGVPEGTFITPSEADIANANERLTANTEAEKGGGNLEAAAELASLGKDIAVGGAKMIGKGVTKAGEYLAGRNIAKETDFIKDLITPELNATKTADAIKTGKVVEGGFMKDRDITNAVPFFEDTAKAVSEVPGISKSNTLLENANYIHDHIGTVANDLVSSLKNSAKGMKVSELAQVPEKFNQYMKGVKATLKENPTLVGDAEKTATKILDKFESLVKEEGSTPDAIISARKKLDNWMSAQKGDNVFDPKTEGAVSVALRAIRQGGNDFVASLSKDVAVKDMLAKQTNLYNAIENIAPKAAKEGASGFKRWIKAHPKLVGTAKILGGAAVGGGTAGALLNQ